MFGMTPSDFADAVSSISGWSAFGILVFLMVFGFFRDWVVTRGQYTAMTSILESQLKTSQEAEARWREVAQEALAQNSKLLGLTEISKKFYTELLAKDQTPPDWGTMVEVTGGD